ncbi:thioredoxin family protein [Chitinophaga sp. 30R24]|uniref:thioredoxin family protein n=1 Tax=Chitinophaga sp. 30R24 TaxID=3248838 RepID=UPI003B90D822
MDFTAYLKHFEAIIHHPAPEKPYDNPDYLNYTKLNWSRMHRWLKQGVLTTAMKDAVLAIFSPQQWIVITEPWCGDASHAIPFFQMMKEENPFINISYELRDTSPFLINDYLTNGSKSIPKLIIRDEKGQDRATWGPRPAACQELYNHLTATKTDFETLKTALQKWYNNDKGISMQEELLALLQSI